MMNKVYIVRPPFPPVVKFLSEGSMYMWHCHYDDDDHHDNDDDSDDEMKVKIFTMIIIWQEYDQ